MTTCTLVIPGTFIACGEGGNYCSERRLRIAASKITPLTPEAAAAFESGPEVSGGLDVEPEDAMAAAVSKTV